MGSRYYTPWVILWVEIKIADWLRACAGLGQVFWTLFWGFWLCDVWIEWNKIGHVAVIQVVGILLSGPE